MKKRERKWGSFWLCLILAVCPLVGSAQSGEPPETIRIDSDLVDLKVSVISLDAQTPTPLLQRDDFVVLEDGQPQTVSFFAAADTPFDLVLLLDVSGSIGSKLKLVRGSAKRFVEATRPTDRIAILSFTDRVQIVSGFTFDRQRLKKAIDDIDKPVGGTKFWDSLRYVLERMVPLSQNPRRTAIVLMTDGVDNALPDIFGDGSSTTFPELLELVRNTDVMLFPIFLDTEKEEVKRHKIPRAAYTVAREQLASLADACGTTLYKAHELKDLDRVYQQVIKDLGTVYSIGYRPANSTRDGKWRSVVVQLIEHKNLVARTRRGYYAGEDHER